MLGVDDSVQPKLARHVEPDIEQFVPKVEQAMREYASCGARSRRGRHLLVIDAPGVRSLTIYCWALPRFAARSAIAAGFGVCESSTSG